MHLSTELLSSPHFSAPPFLFPAELSIPESFPAGFGVQGFGTQPALASTALGSQPSPPTPLPCFSLPLLEPAVRRPLGSLGTSSAQLRDPSWLCASYQSNSFAFSRAERGGPAPISAPAFLHLYSSISVRSIHRSGGLLGRSHQPYWGLERRPMALSGRPDFSAEPLFESPKPREKAEFGV